MSLTGQKMREAAGSSRSRLKTAVVDAKEYGAGETIRVRELTAQEMLLWSRNNDRIREDDTAPSGAVFMICMAAIDDDGNKTLTMQDADWLKDESASLVTRVASKIMVMSGLADDDESDESGKDSSEPTGAHASPTDSPNDSEA